MGDGRESQTISTGRDQSGHPRHAAGRSRRSGSGRKSGVEVSAAQRWGKSASGTCSKHGPADSRRKEVPTLKTFAPRFLSTDMRARTDRNPAGLPRRNCCSGALAAAFLGHKRLDAITNEDVQRLKASMVAKSPKTVNNVLAVLSVLLKKAVEWGVIDRMPCTIRLLAIPKSTAAFHDFDQYERLVETAKAVDRAHRADRAAGWRGRGALRGDDRPGVEGRGLEQAAALRPAVRLERPRHRTERWATAIRAADGATDGGSSRAPTSAGATGVVSGRRRAAHPA